MSSWTLIQRAYLFIARSFALCWHGWGILAETLHHLCPQNHCIQENMCIVMLHIGPVHMFIECAARSSLLELSASPLCVWLSYCLREPTHVQMAVIWALSTHLDTQSSQRFIEHTCRIYTCTICTQLQASYQMHVGTDVIPFPLCAVSGDSLNITKLFGWCEVVHIYIATSGKWYEFPLLKMEPPSTQNVFDKLVYPCYFALIWHCLICCCHYWIFLPLIQHWGPPFRSIWDMSGICRKPNANWNMLSASAAAGTVSVLLAAFLPDLFLIQLLVAQGPESLRRGESTQLRSSALLPS